MTAALEADSNKGPDAIGGKDGGDHNFVYKAGTNKKLTPSSVPARAEPDSLKQGLVLWLTFDEGTGTTTKDLSGNGNNGTLINNPQWVEGKIGKALMFNNSGGRVEVPDNDLLSTHAVDSTQEQTIVVWIKPTIPLSGGIEILGKGGQWEYGIIIYDPTKQVNINYWNGLNGCCGWGLWSYGNVWNYNNWTLITTVLNRIEIETI